MSRQPAFRRPPRWYLWRRNRQPKPLTWHWGARHAAVNLAAAVAGHGNRLGKLAEELLRHIAPVQRGIKFCAVDGNRNFGFTRGRTGACMSLFGRPSSSIQVATALWLVLTFFTSTAMPVPATDPLLARTTST